MQGKVWKFGDNIDTDLIIAARYLNTSDASELAKHVMEDEDPTFVSKMSAGDIIVAGENFGCGSSREHAPIALKEEEVDLSMRIEEGEDIILDAICSVPYLIGYIINYKGPLLNRERRVKKLFHLQK